MRRLHNWTIVCAALLLGCPPPAGPAEPAPTTEAATANSAAAPAASAPSIETGSVAAALAGPHRSEAHRARDRYRHPAETLKFFGLEPTMTVVEIWPGGRAWYTEVLAPVMRDHGELITATLDPADKTFRGRFGRELREKMNSTPAIYDQVQTSILMAPDQFEIAPAGTVDMVLSFRSAHNWIRWEGHTPEPYFAAIAKALKPGGIFGIVQHRAPEGHPHGDDGTIGYLYASLIIQQAKDAGLELIARSEINANPKDTHDHPEGVWTLPPTLALGDERKSEWLAIGESDRMTLKFQKPTGAR